jgi:anti-anti-sigma factor
VPVDQPSLSVPLMPASGPEIPDRAPTPFGLEVERDSEVVIARISGDVDLRTGPALVNQVMDAVQGHEAKDVILDFAAVGFIDSRGLRCVLNLHERLAGDHGHLVLNSPTRAVRQVLGLAGLDERMAIATTLEQARVLLHEQPSPPDDGKT